MSQTHSLYWHHHPNHLPPVFLFFLIFLKALLVNHHCWLCLHLCPLGAASDVPRGSHPLLRAPSTHSVYHFALILPALTIVYVIICFYLYLPILGCPQKFQSPVRNFPRDSSNISPLIENHIYSLPFSFFTQCLAHL